MPTKLPELRRSGRTSGGKIPSPKYKHDLFQDPPTIRSKKKKVPQPKKLSVRKPETGDSYVLEEEEQEGKEVVSEKPITSHPSKNYDKIDLYSRWVRSRNEATDNKNLLEELQKESRRDQREINRLRKELDGAQKQVVNLQDKFEKAQFELQEERKKRNLKNGSSEKVSNSERIANMRATYLNLTEKKEYEHKSSLLDLQLKYSDMELKYNAKEEKIKRLEQELKEAKKGEINYNELKVAFLKQEIQVSSMHEKNMVRYVINFCRKFLSIVY